MALMPVNDPELLQQLGSPTGNLSPVADPELLKQLNGEGTTEDPGLLKSAAAGLMSGVPLAESAVAGVKSLVNDTPYAKEHEALEALKDASWDAHPIAYGAGKTAGMVGTGLVAPEGIPGAIGIGAASGLDQATQLSDVPGDVLKGGAVGGVLGTIGEKVISPFVHETLPTLAKGIVGSLGKGTDTAGVEAYLANPGLINAAKGPEAQTEIIRSLTDELQNHINKASARARSTLDPESFTNMKELTPFFDEIKGTMMTDGESGPAQQRAIATLSKWEDMLSRVAGKNPGETSPEGQIPQTAIADVIRQIDANKLNYTDSDSTVVNKALVAVRDRLDQGLKLANPDYDKAMQPVSELMGLKTNLEKTFALNNPNPDVTSARLANVLKDNKSNAQDLLGKLDEHFGSDVVGNAKNYQVQAGFNAPGAGEGLRTLLTGLGFAGGKMTGIPFGGIGGAAIGRSLSSNIDGGAIAKSILDMYIKGSQNMADRGVTAALQKFGPVLANAAKAGGNELASTHFVLATSNPEYQTLVQHTQDNQ